MIVELTKDEIDSLIRAVKVADYEGYGPDQFGYGNWDSLLDKLTKLNN